MNGERLGLHFPTEQELAMYLVMDAKRWPEPRERNGQRVCADVAVGLTFPTRAEMLAATQGV